MAGSATITAKIGAGQQATTLALADVVEFGFDCDRNVCFVKLRNGRVEWFAGYSTITVTVAGTGAGAAYVLTIS
jgi:hypothetical protein